MQRYLLVLCAIALSICCLNTSCTKNGNQHNDTLNYELKKVSLTFNQCKADSPDCAHITYNYPVFTDKTGTADSLNHIINLLLGVSGKNTLEKTQQTFLAEYASFTKQYPDNEQIWFSQTDIDVPYQSGHLVCIGVNMNDYTGGAHGMQARSYSCYNKRNNKVLTLAQLFNDSAYKLVLQLAEKAFRQQENLSQTSDLEDAGFWFKDNTFHLNDNFLITNKGVTWLFNPYEVSSYSKGMIEISLTKEEIAPLLHQNYSTIWD